MTRIVVKVCCQDLLPRLSSRLLPLNRLTHLVCQIFFTLFLSGRPYSASPMHCMVLSPCGLRLATKCSERLKHTEFHSETGEGIISSWPPNPQFGGTKQLSQAPPFSVVVHIRDVFGCKKRPRLVSLIFNHMTSYRGVTSGNEHRNDNWNEMVR